MKIHRVGVGLLVVLSLGAFPLATGAASAASKPLHDGLYETAGVGPGYYSLELQVVGNGTRILGGLKGSGEVCTASPASIARSQ